MKRYLVVFITEGEFACLTVEADSIIDAATTFDAMSIAFEEIYSITRAA